MAYLKEITIVELFYNTILKNYNNREKDGLVINMSDLERNQVFT